ncbi:MAG: rubredoxin [Bacteroidia bacterium]|nr:rubredoxin [Bacteroidia bacterium]
MSIPCSRARLSISQFGINVECLSRYRPDQDDSLNNIKAGTAFNDLLDSYTCMLCSAPTASFKKILPFGKENFA